MISRILLPFSFLIISINSFGQDYALDLSDTSTYSINCGKVVPSAWTVKLDSCQLHTPYLQTSNSEPSWMVYTVRINQSGNLGTEENAYIHHQINDGSWITDTVLIGAGLDAVFDLTDSIYMDIGDVFRIRVTYETNAKTEFWQLKNGDIQVNNAVIQGSAEEPMPVEMLYFNIERNENFIDLKWATASETNNSYFCIERSFDAVVFDSVGTVQGTGNSNTLNEYYFNDIANSNTIIYYRIKQVDFDGKYEYSNLVTTSGQNNQEIVDVVVNNSEYSLMICCKNNASVQLNVINATTGQVANQIQYQVAEGETYIPLNEIISQSGIYCISSKMNNNFFSKIIPFNRK